MAAPVAGEVWECSTTSENDDEYSSSTTHSHKYYVDEIVTRFGSSRAKIRMVDTPDAAGWYKYVPSAYMDASTVWSKFV